MEHPEEGRRDPVEEDMHLHQSQEEGRHLLLGLGVGMQLQADLVEGSQPEAVQGKLVVAGQGSQVEQNKLGVVGWSGDKAAGQDMLLFRMYNLKCLMRPPLPKSEEEELL